MARGKWLSSEEKESIMEMHAGGMSAAQIATKMERGVKSIQRVLNAKDERPLQANVVTVSAPAGVPANVLRPPEPVATNAHVTYPQTANVMEMRASGMTAAQIVSEMETAFQLTQRAPSTVVTLPPTSPVLPGRHAGPCMPPFPAPTAQTVPEQVPAVDMKAAAPPKTIKRPQAPRPNAKKSPPKTKAAKAQQSSTPIQASPQQQSPVESQARSQLNQEQPQQPAKVAAHHNFQASAQPIGVTSSSMATAHELQHPQSFGISPAVQTYPPPPRNESVAYSSHSTHNSSVHADVEMTSSYTEQLTRDAGETFSRQHGVECMVNVIPDEDSDEEEEDEQSHDQVMTQQAPSRGMCVRRPPRINDAIAAPEPSRLNSHPVSSSSTSQTSGNMEQVEPQAHSAPAGAQTEMLRSFEAELESSQAQTQTPPTSQIEPEPWVAKKRKIDASDVTKPAADPINHAMSLLAKAVEDSNASRKAGFTEKRLALLFQRFQADIQLLQLEQQRSEGATSWEL